MARLILKVRRALATGGVRRLATLALGSMRPRRQAAQEQRSELDARYGMDTSGCIDQVDLDTHAYANWIHGVYYQASDEGILGRLIAASGIQPGDYTFVDLGCGKGRMLFAALELGFKAAIGVEFSAELLRVATENARLFRQRRPDARIELRHIDAADFEFPTGNVVLYLYNPFGEPVMQRVAQHARGRCGNDQAPLWVWYHNPRCADCWDTAGFQRVVELADINATMWSRRQAPTNATMQ